MSEETRQVIYYVGAALSMASSIDILSHINKEKAVPLSKTRDFHSTLAYSRSWFPYKAADGPVFPLVVEPPFETILLGQICVLLFRSEALAKRYSEFRRSGASYDYPDFRLHISLTKRDLIPPPRFSLTFSHEYYGTWKE